MSYRLLMRRYLRSRSGQVYFFTLVTHDRRPFLTTDTGRSALRGAIRHVRQTHPFRITAIVLLPDHLHAVLELPDGDSDYSTRWRLIKSQFTRRWREAGGMEGIRSQSRREKGERGVWQRRFYEHTCRDEGDLKRCVDYVHVNPLKHGLVESVCDWPWSSFHRYVRLGEYSSDWGNADDWYGDEFLNAE
jgi:putative transposase